MSDLDILVFGCVVSFITLAGAYLGIRAGLDEHEGVAESEPQRDPARTALVPVPVPSTSAGEASGRRR